MKNEQHHFIDVKGKNKNGRNNTKRAEKSYFHCTLYYLWKEDVVIKTVIVVIKQDINNYKDNISDNDNDSNMNVI